MRIFPAIVVLGITGAGYLYHQEQKGQPEPLTKVLSTAGEWISAIVGEDEPSEEDTKTTADAATSDKAQDADVTERDSPAATAEAVDFAEVFRFDVTVDQVHKTWNRVNDKVKEPGLKGYRVPLATGSSGSDLTGSLTYYFDSTQPRRITFSGTTADPGRLVEFLQRQFGFQRAGSKNGRVSTFSSRKDCSGLLRMTAPAKAEDRFQIDLSIAR